MKRPRPDRDREAGLCRRSNIPFKAVPFSSNFLSPLKTCFSSSSTMDSRFQYTPLEPYETARVITILPGDDDTEIECMIQHTSLETPKPYIALSYVWGDPTVKKCICLNGRPFFITENLYVLLHQMRIGLNE